MNLGAKLATTAAIIFGLIIGMVIITHASPTISAAAVAANATSNWSAVGPGGEWAQAATNGLPIIWYIMPFVICGIALVFVWRS